ncbi:hypothetical protein ACFWP3_39155 [Streptomyces sp. NPDC058525]|uniref:hypothetical protein n=1 Tax=Streptomyces sp. NPDC058525 TaxID=3346538 RepID=UPI0036621711
MPNTLEYDPANLEGRAIGRLFRLVKDNEDADGSWDGGDVVELLNGWFTGLGLNINGPAHQAGPVKPTAISPDATAEEITQILMRQPGFTANGYPTGHPGFFYAQEDSDDETDFTVLTFPTATPALVRAAIAELRHHGYAASEQAPATAGGRAVRTVRVQGDVLLPLPAAAGPVERATRTLYDAGFTQATSQATAVVPAHTTPSLISWRPDWVQIDVISQRGLGRDAREEVSRAVADTLVQNGWAVEIRGTESLHASVLTHAKCSACGSSNIRYTVRLWAKCDACGKGQSWSEALTCQCAPAVPSECPTVQAQWSDAPTETTHRVDPDSETASDDRRDSPGMSS